MNNYLLPSILAPACLTWCYSPILENKNSRHVSFSLAGYSFSSHIFYRLASPSLLSLSLDKETLRTSDEPHFPSLHSNQFLLKMWDQICMLFTQTWSIHRDVLYFVLNTLLLGRRLFWIWLLFIHQQWADDFITLRLCSKAIMINARAHWAAYEAQIIFPHHIYLCSASWVSQKCKVT